MAQHHPPTPLSYLARAPATTRQLPSAPILVVEAGLKSGTLITANFAKKFGRKIFAVPGPITSEVSKGTSQLLKDGADLVTSAKDIIDFFGLRNLVSEKETKFPGTINSVEGKIAEQLKREPLDVDGLSRILGISAPKLGTALAPKA